MSLTRVNTNPQSLLAGMYMRQVESALSRTMERLSTGSKIATAASDPSAAGISAVLNSQLGGTRAAIKNAEDTLSMLMVVDTALQGVTDKLNRAKELAVSASNAVTTSNAERSVMHAEWTEIVSSIKELRSSVSFNGVQILSGALSGATVKIGPNGAITYSLNVPTLSCDAAGPFGVAISAGTGAIILSGDGSQAATAIGQLSTAILNFSKLVISVANQEKHMEETITRLQSAEVNLAAVVSRVADADMAQEISEFARQQVVAQAATAMIAQANLQPQSVLSLLGSV